VRLFTRKYGKFKEYENNVLRRIFGCEDEISEQLRISLSGELSDLYRKIKSMMIQLTGRGTTAERPGMYAKFWWGNLFENIHLEDRLY
jgi:hypothetical protein